MSLTVGTAQEVFPSSTGRAAVYALATAGERARKDAPCSPENAGIGVLLLGLLLSANPRKNEPIEDAFGGMVQNLVCEKVF